LEIGGGERWALDPDNAGLWALAERLEVLARLEANGLAGGDGDLGTCARISSDTGLARLDGEDAEAAELDTVAAAQGVLHRFKNSVHGGFCLRPWKACALNYPLD
jgi:hypothetical protein